MTDRTNRRDFLRSAAAVSGLAALSSADLLRAADAARPAAAALPAGAPTTKPVAATRPATAPFTGRHLKVAAIGTAGRGTELAVGFAQLPGVSVKYVCDVDQAHAAKAADAVAKRQDARPQVVADMRRVLDDMEIDAVAIATPDHWHAPAALLAIAAGKHVYVEKPCSHNPREGELLVEAARKHKAVVQHGTQRRSWPKNVEAIKRLHAGEFGKVLFSRGWYNNARPETGKRTPASVPPGLDWDLWQGPAPRQAFTENVVHYKWHWFWHWGTGEMGNNGVHSLDVCRWGLGVDYPRTVTAGGGRYHFKDDQETPDTLNVTFDYADKAIVWEGRSCHPRGPELGTGFGAAFYGDAATLIIDGAGYRVFDPKGKEAEVVKGSGGNGEHLQNFCDGIRDGAPLAAGIEEGVKSTLICHLGNIAYRTGGAVALDPKSHRAVGKDAMALWGREYEKGWEPKV